MSKEGENRQIVTRWASDRRDRLVTELELNTTPELKQGEVLVKMLYVPMHGSFWLASHPDVIHPRVDEFMADGRFAFGNGGVGQVIKSNEDPRVVREGDYVCVFGHIPCDHYDCYACNVLHRYVECDYGESGILGHGKNTPDGTYANYVALPRYSYNVCYREAEKPTEEQLKAFMFAFLLADVRNALTRHPDTLRQRRMILFGAGYSGQIAAYIHNRSCPEAKVFVVDSNAAHLEEIRKIDSNSVGTYLLRDDVVAELNGRHQNPGFRHELRDTISEISDAAKAFFGGRKANLIFDSTSGNSAPLWDNSEILAPSMHCIPFGFGSQYVLLSKEIIQMSGLNLGMSRGVGNLRNRQETIELIKAGAGEFLRELLIAESRCLFGMNEAIDFVSEMHNPPRAMHNIPHAYVMPNGKL